VTGVKESTVKAWKFYLTLIIEGETDEEVQEKFHRTLVNIENIDNADEISDIDYHDSEEIDHPFDPEGEE